MNVTLRAPGWLKEFLSFEGEARGGYVFVAYILVMVLAGALGALAGFAWGRTADVAVEAALMLLIAPTFVRRMHYNLRSRWWALLPILTLNPGAKAVAQWSETFPAPVPMLISLTFGVAALAALYMLIAVNGRAPSGIAEDEAVEPAGSITAR